MIKRVVLWALIGLLLLVVVLSLTLSALLYSEGGTRWLLNRITPFVPGELNYDTFEGSVYKGFNMAGLHYSNDGMVVRASDITFTPEWTELMARRVTISQLQLHDLHITLLPTEKEEEKEDKPPFHPDQLGNILLPVSVHIYNAELHNFMLTTATGGQIPIEHVKLSANIAKNKLSIEHLGVKTTEQKVRVYGQMGLLQPLRLDAAVYWQTLLPEGAQTLFGGAEEAKGELKLKGPLAKFELQHALETPTRMQTQATLAAFDTPLAVDLKHTWEALTLHLPEGKFDTLPVEEGTLTLSGDLDNYQLKLNTGTQVALTDDAQPAVKLEIQADGDLSHLNVKPITVTVGESTLRINGALNWQPSLTWDVAVSAKKLDPSIVAKDYPGNINAELKSQGSFTEQGIDAVAELLTLNGSWLTQPLRGKGNAKLSHNGALQGKLEVALGENQVNVNGKMNDNIDANFALAIRDLSHFVPSFTGTINGDVKVTGKKIAPILKGHLQGDQIAINDLSIQRLRLDANTSGRVEDPNVNVAFRADQIQNKGETLLNDAQLNVTGRFSQHNANWTFNAGEYQHVATLTGQLNKKNEWAGKLNQFDISGPMTGLWSLAQTVTLNASASKAGIKNFCLQQADAAVCADGQWQQNGTTTGHLDVRAVPLAAFNPLIPSAAAKLTGELNAQGNFKQAGKAPAAGDLRLTISPGHVELDTGDDNPYLIPWEGLETTATLQNQRFDTKLNFIIDEHTGIQGTLAGHLQQAINGHFKMNMSELGWVEIVSPEIREAKGTITADLYVGGTLADFTLDGDVNLTGLGLQIPMLGLALSEGNVTAVAKQGQPIVIDGSILSGKGKLNLKGEVPTTGEFPRPITLAVTGKNFQVANIPEAEVYINPDVQAELVGMDLFLRGVVTVPKAHISPKQLPTSAVNVSNDQIILDEEIEDKTLLNIDAELRVVLGDEVTVEGFGLNARFGGDLMVTEKPGKSTRINGDIRIIEGRFKAVGQDLTVENGTIFFQGSPNNPGLDIRAFRDVKAYNVRAGLELGGTLSDPRSRVYSEPDMDETEAMSFLLTGKPLDSGSDTDAAAIMQAIALYGIEKGDFITDRVGDKLGLDVGIDADGEFEDTALMLGKQLSSRLYLRYSIGLFEALNTVMLSYAINRYLNLETRSNAEEQTVDLIYRTER
ncbi:MAG TPA: translocation/assembly module TamB domain-containing protein [Alcanivoracaceae bacterium]|nr:translocation/assembly module TamB domain-containing protein [Alcanivoracaceae bacterium]